MKLFFAKEIFIPDYICFLVVLSCSDDYYNWHMKTIHWSINENDISFTMCFVQ